MKQPDHETESELHNTVQSSQASLIHSATMHPYNNFAVPFNEFSPKKTEAEKVEF